MSSSKTVRVDAVMTDSCVVQADIRGHQMTIDQPKGAGGEDKGPTPLELFLFSLGGCIASIGRIAARQQKIDLQRFELNISGNYDPAGLLGKPSEHRNGFQSIQVQAQIEAPGLSDAQKQAFLDEVCERCPLHDNIRLATEVTHNLNG